jgi:4-hydroxybenzoate polyprenyltransferase
LVISLGISYVIHFGFFIFALGFFILTQFYSLFLKHIIFADVTAISINFVLRAVSGAVLINVYVSPWLVVCTFFFALFLALCKRRGDILLLKKEAKNTRKVFEHYTRELVDMSVATSAATLLLSYGMYSSMATEGYLMMLTIPLVTFLIFRYLYLSISHPKIVRHPERIFKDKQTITGMLIWILMVFLILYVQII